MVRNARRLQEVVSEIDAHPGIVLFTIADERMTGELEEACRNMGLPCVSILDPVFKVFQSYLGMPSARKTGAQHELNAEYFNRIDALNFTLMHDDGVLPDDIEEADIILLGISRTSKTPTSIYLANRGIRVANVPLVPPNPLPSGILKARRPLVAALVASADRIHHVRQNRILGAGALSGDSSYTDRAGIAEELAFTRKLCKKNGWPMIDVSRKSIEETAAALQSLLGDHRNSLKDTE